MADTDQPQTQSAATPPGSNVFLTNDETEKDTIDVQNKQDTPTSSNDAAQDRSILSLENSDAQDQSNLSREKSDAQNHSVPSDVQNHSTHRDLEDQSALFPLNDDVRNNSRNSSRISEREPSNVKNNSTLSGVPKRSRSIVSGGHDEDKENSVLGFSNTKTPSVQHHHYSSLQSMSKVDRNRRMMSQMSALSKGSFYDHGDYVDENLLLSATKLDSTLIRLFSDPNPEDKDYRLQNGNHGIPYVDYAQSDLISMDAVKWRIHPMKSCEKETLTTELDYLEGSIQPREVVSRLYQEDVLTLLDYNMINRTEGQGQRAVTRLLVRTLQRRGHLAFKAFIAALNDLGYSHVATKLLNTENSIKTGISHDRHKDQWGNQQPPDLGYTTSSTIPSTTPFDRDTPHSAVLRRHLDEHDTSAEPHQSQELQKHIDDMKTELRALHDDVTALKSSRRATPSVPVASTPITEENTAPTRKDPKEKAQKASTCSIL